MSTQTTTKETELAAVKIGNNTLHIFLNQKLEQSIEITCDYFLNPDEILELIKNSKELKTILDKAECAIHNAKTGLADVPGTER